ncbi:hypothetical protein [Ilumatobacter nonamiensis]|uniref:hypothetical protein n=1 Tax=Ilumatobacter nonamiensis TaxID=467093 RepID=UPI0003496561|nr:hypothetical protein [Ilumatobacter nonamiensis]
MSSADHAVERFCTGQSVGIGSLPHRDAAAAAAFSISEFDIATVPTLPNRSPAEAMIDQALAGLTGTSWDADGSLVIDPSTLAMGDAPPDLDTDAFGGLTAFIHLARQVGVNGSPVKWQFVGPVTLGVALARAGVDHADAFAIATESVRRHTSAISAVIADALPSSPQLMLLDEPWLVELMANDFPIPPDVAVDLISAGMATVSPEVAVGLHCCGPVDVATMLEAGPQVISLPVSDDLVEYAGYLGRFIKSGGVIVWGALPTTGPLPTRSDRFWRDLSAVWCALVERGVDASELRLRSLVSPECGLARHQVSTARRVARLTSEIGRKVNAQAISTKLAFGA